MSKLKHVSVLSGDILVEELPNFYGSSEEKRFSTEAAKIRQNKVGRVVRISDRDSELKQFEGSLVYYQDLSGAAFEIKGLGEFRKISKASVLAFEKTEIE